MRMRIVNWGDGPLKVALMKGQTICTSCTSVTDPEGIKVRGPGCVKCDPDKGVDELMKNDHADVDELMLDAQAKLFFHDAVDMIEHEDLDPVEDWDMVTEAEIKRRLVMEDEEVDGIDEIYEYDFVYSAPMPNAKLEEKTFRREFGFEMVMVDETNDPADPLDPDDCYRSEAPIKTLLRNTGLGADKLLFEDAA